MSFEARPESSANAQYDTVYMRQRRRNRRRQRPARILSRRYTQNSQTRTQSVAGMPTIELGLRKIGFDNARTCSDVACGN